MYKLSKKEKNRRSNGGNENLDLARGGGTSRAHFAREDEIVRTVKSK